MKWLLMKLHLAFGSMEVSDKPLELRLRNWERKLARNISYKFYMMVGRWLLA
jgi:hypothetical protein